MAQILGTYSAIQCVSIDSYTSNLSSPSRPRCQQWVWLHNCAGTIRGRGNFRLKQALACGVNSKAARNQGDSTVVPFLWRRSEQMDEIFLGMWQTVVSPFTMVTAKRIGSIESFPSTSQLLAHSGITYLLINMIESDHCLYKERKTLSMLNVVTWLFASSLTLTMTDLGGARFACVKEEVWLGVAWTAGIHKNEKHKISSGRSRGISAKVCTSENTLYSIIKYRHNWH